MLRRRSMYYLPPINSAFIQQSKINNQQFMSDLKKNLPPIQPPHRRPANSHKYQGIDQRCISRPAKMFKPAVVNHLLQTKSADRDVELNSINEMGHDFSKKVSGNRIHPKHQPRSRPSTPLLDVQNPVAKRQANQREPRREQDKRTRPQVLVNRKPHIPQFTRSQSQNPDSQQPPSLGPRTTLQTQPLACQRAEQRRRDCRDSAQHALRITSVVVQMAEQQLAIQPSRQIAVRIKKRNISPRHSEPRHRNKTHDQ